MPENFRKASVPGTIEMGNLQRAQADLGVQTPDRPTPTLR